jgi:hypothetical protein
MVVPMISGARGVQPDPRRCLGEYNWLLILEIVVSGTFGVSDVFSRCVRLLLF